MPPAPPLSPRPARCFGRFELSNISGAFITVDETGTIYTADKDRLWALNPDGTVKWTFDDAGGAGGLPSGGGGHPVDLLPDGRLVVASGHTIWALTPDGEVDWSFAWTGGYNNQVDNGPSVGPDGNIYATTGINDGEGFGAFSLDPDGNLRWQDEGEPSLYILNASHSQRVQFTTDRMVFGFVATTGPPFVYVYDFDGDQTNLVDYTCTSSPRTSVDHLLMAGQCGVQAIDLDDDSIVWNVGLGPVNLIPIVGSDGRVYSGRWLGPASAISAAGDVLWTSVDVDMQRTLALSEQHRIYLFTRADFGAPNHLGALDADTGALLWEVPFETVDGHHELSWSNEAAFSPGETVAYFTTRFTSNGAPGRLYAVSLTDTIEGPLAGDANGDGVVDVVDLTEVILAWGVCPSPPAPCPGDFDLDGDVDVIDLLEVVLNWSP